MSKRHVPVVRWFQHKKTKSLDSEFKCYWNVETIRTAWAGVDQYWIDGKKAIFKSHRKNTFCVNNENASRSSWNKTDEIDATNSNHIAFICFDFIFNSTKFVSKLLNLKLNRIIKWLFSKHFILFAFHTHILHKVIGRDVNQLFMNLTFTNTTWAINPRRNNQIRKIVWNYYRIASTLTRWFSESLEQLIRGNNEEKTLAKIVMRDTSAIIRRSTALKNKLWMNSSVLIDGPFVDPTFDYII